MNNLYNILTVYITIFGCLSRFYGPHRQLLATQTDTNDGFYCCTISVKLTNIASKRRPRSAHLPAPIQRLMRFRRKLTEACRRQCFGRSGVRSWVSDTNLHGSPQSAIKAGWNVQATDASQCRSADGACHFCTFVQRNLYCTIHAASLGGVTP